MYGRTVWYGYNVVQGQRASVWSESNVGDAQRGIEATWGSRNTKLGSQRSLTEVRETPIPTQYPLAPSDYTPTLGRAFGLPTSPIYIPYYSSCLALFPKIYSSIAAYIPRPTNIR